MARITPCLENGKISKYSPKEKTESPAFGSTEFIVLRGKKGVSDSNYVYYFSRYPLFRNYAIGQMTGSSGRQRVPTDAIRKYLTKFPPLSEQRRIAHILGTLDDKIALNRQQNATLEAMAQALFRSWFVDFDPVLDKALAAGHDIPEPLQAKAQRRLALGDKRKPLPPEVAGLFPDRFVYEEEVGWVPEGWVVKPLYETAEFVNGAAFKSTDFSSKNEGLPIIKIAELKSGISGQTKFTSSSVKGKYKIEKGDLLYSWSGSPSTSLEAFIWNGPDGWLNQHIFKVNTETEDHKVFVFNLLKYLKPTLINIARNKQTTGLGHVTVRDMKKLFVVVPGKKLEPLVHSSLLALHEKLYSNLVDSENLQNLRDTLLPKLISGELRVPAAESLVEKGI